MQSKLTIRNILTSPWVAAIFLGAVMVPAQVFGGRPLPPEGKGDPDGRPPLLEVKVETSYTGNAEAKFRGGKYGDSDAFDINVSVSTLTPLSEKWFIPFELQSQNLELGSRAGLPVPDDINTFEFGTGLAYRPNDRWMFMARINAALYKFEDVGGNDIGISGGLMAMWEYSPSIKWTFGLMVQPDNDDLPVIPMIGVSWKINERWELDLMLLSPRLIYTVNDKLKFHAGMGKNFGTTFRSSDTLGTSIGRAKFNDALGSYSDMRFGGGFEYQLSKSFCFEAEACYATGREIKYDDIDEKVKFGDAPYVRVGLKYEF
ncbi:MAG TPA: DUF6268 family outer membrane beta-barrel protein [Roseimicrobium sp.]|nr:DUF6268 family outer membrane beta-barrel protein [Roseimicrobium sp.]